MLTSDNRNAKTAVRIRVGEYLNSEKNQQSPAEWNWRDYDETSIGKTAFRLRGHGCDWSSNSCLSNDIIAVLVETSNLGLGLVEMKEAFGTGEKVERGREE